MGMAPGLITIGVASRRHGGYITTGALLTSLLDSMATGATI
jgi:hypothetical protein